MSMRQGPTDRATGQQVTLRRVAEPWTLILVTTGLFQVFRGAPVDGAFFLVIAALLVADAFGLVRVPETRMPRRGAMFGIAVVLGVLMVIAPRHGWVEGLIVSAIGVSVLIFAWPNPEATKATADPLRRAAIAWSLVGVALALWEVSSFLLGLPSPQAQYAHPSISLLFDPVLDTVLGRTAYTAVWLLAGIGLLRRGQHR